MDIITPRYNQAFKPQKKWFKKPLFYTFAIILAVIGYFSFQLGLTGKDININNSFAWKSFSKILEMDVKIKNKEHDPNPMPKPEKDRLDVLVLGIRGENDIENGGFLTDSIMILSIDKVSKKAAIVSVPRDLYLEMLVDTQSGEQIRIHNKINEIYEKGLINKEGLNFVEQVVSKITGVYIDKTIVFDHEAFKVIVDYLGGIDLHLEKPFKETKQWGYEFYLPAGDNHINGDQALYYVRSRFSTNDFDRSRRQQEVIKAIKNKAAGLGLLSNPIKVVSLFSDLNKDIKTDFQVWNVKDLLAVAASISDRQIQNYFITTDNFLNESRAANGEYVLLPKSGNFDEIRIFFKNALAKS